MVRFNSLMLALAVATAPAALAAQLAAPEEGLAEATFAGGCFWCMEPPYDRLDGVISTTSGYTGGHVENPSYQQVTAGGTGHYEAVRVVYEPDKVSYEKLLDVFWHNIDPLDDGGQFCDRGSSYRTAIFVHNDAQRDAAERSKVALEANGRFEQPIVTPIVEAQPFYAAEGYHQDYYEKNPVRYKTYRYLCGRDDQLKQVWGERAGG